MAPNGEEMVAIKWKYGQRNAHQTTNNITQVALFSLEQKINLVVDKFLAKSTTQKPVVDII